MLNTRLLMKIFQYMGNKFKHYADPIFITIAVHAVRAS
jgi:hypothetical protein